jgi:hypothetical protein
MKPEIKAIALIAVGLLLSLSEARADVITLSGDLDASQVVDGGGSTSSATGSAVLSIDTVAETLSLDFSWDGLSGPADRAHLHDASLGQSRFVDPFDTFFDEIFDNLSIMTIDCPWSQGGTQFCVPASGGIFVVQDLANVIELNDPLCDPILHTCSVAQLLSLALNDRIYIDIHTQLYPSAEIRGQLFPELAVPEPSVLLLLACGLFAALWQLRAVQRARRAPGREGWNVCGPPGTAGS